MPARGRRSRARGDGAADAQPGVTRTTDPYPDAASTLEAARTSGRHRLGDSAEALTVADAIDRLGGYDTNTALVPEPLAVVLPTDEQSLTGPDPADNSTAGAGGTDGNDGATPTTAVRGSVVTLAGQAVRFVVQTAALALLAHFLSPRDYGLVAMVTAIVGIAATFGDFGLSLAAMQAKTLSRGQRSNLFWLNAATGLVAGGIVCAFAGPIASFYGEPALRQIVFAMSLTFVLNGLTSQFRAELSRRFRFLQLSVVDVLAQVLGLVVAVAGALADFGYWALVLQQLTIAATTLLSAAWFSGWRPGLPKRGQQMRALVSFGANTMGVQVITYASANVDNIAVGRFWGSAALGVYSRAYTLFELPVQQLAAPLTRVVLPILSRVEDDAQFCRYTQRAQLMMSYGLISTFAVAASVAQPMIAIVLGNQWHDAAAIFQVLAIGGTFQAYGYMFYWIFLAKGAVKAQFRYSVTGRATMVVLIVVGATFSPLGAAVGAAGGLLTVWLVYSLWGVPRNNIPIGPVMSDAARTISLFAVMALAAQAVYIAVLHTLPPAVALVTGLGIDAAVLALAFAVIPRVRRDITTFVATCKLVANRRPAV